MATSRTSADYLAQAEILVCSSAPFSKDAEARTRTLIAMAQLVAGNGQRKNAVPPAFVRWLRSGVGWKPERRDMDDQGGGAFPGSTGGYFTPTEFVDEVWSALRATDALFDPTVVTMPESGGGGPWAFPLADDVENAASLVDQNAPSNVTDAPISSLQFPACPSWRSGGLKISTETVLDSAVDLVAFLTAAFAVRFQRGFSPTLIAKLLAVAQVVATAEGADASGQVMPKSDGTAQSSIGSDDLAATLAGIDPAYLANASWLMNESTMGAIFGLRGSTGNLVFKGHRDPVSGCYMLLGKPIRICPSMPSMGTSGSPLEGNIPVVLGDLRRLCIRKVKGGTYIVRGDETFATSGQVWFEGFTRADGGVLWYASNPSTPAPFVALQNAS